MKERFLCKAKRVDNGEWIVGYYAYLPDVNLISEPDRDSMPEYKHYILDDGFNSNEVMPETIGKRIYAAYDKNNNPIFEKDILLHKDIKLQLMWDFGQLEYYFADIKGFFYSDKIYCTDGIDLDKCEIIGNIFD